MQSLVDKAWHRENKASLMRPLYLNPRDELRVCLWMETLQKTCTGMEGERAKAVKRKWRDSQGQKTVEEPKWQEGIFVEMKGQRTRAKIQSDIPFYC